MQEQQARPIGRRLVSARQGSRGSELGGQGARVKVSLAERYMAVGTEVGTRTSVASHLVVVLEISKILVWKSASIIGT